MGEVFRTIGHAAVLVLLGTAAGFGANAARSKGSLDPTRNYFDKTINVPHRSEVASRAPSPSATNGTNGVEAKPARTGNAPKKIEHEFLEISLADVVHEFNSERRFNGLTVFVDARNEEHFADGHIPGAVLFDHYELARYLDDTLARVQGSANVIVYCNGGDCEDSIFACKALLDAGVPYDTIHLFAGGWKEWTANNLEVDTGTDER